MSLPEAYRLAHTAECRLKIAASRPDRDLRVVVGHLIHYESLRLRIVEMEHVTPPSNLGGSNTLQPQRKPSTGQLRRRSPPPAAAHLSDTDSDDSDSDSYQDEIADEGGDLEDLVLQRYTTGSTRELDERQPPPLEADGGDDEDDDEDEPRSPEEPDDATLAEITKGKGDDEMMDLYHGVSKCPCHGHKDVPQFTKVWQLPPGEDGKKRAVAAVV